MFGFLKLQSFSLTPDDRQIYQSHFCSVCHAMTEFGGRVSSLLTNYDITFWLLLASALDQRPVRPVEERGCTAFPLRQVPVRPLSPELAKTMACLNLVLVESKAVDDQQDGETLKAGAARMLYGRKFEKARTYLKQAQFPLDALEELPRAQARVEKLARPTLAELSAPTSHALSEVFACISTLHAQPQLEAPLRAFGSNLGGYLYLWDATEDLAEDTKKGKFNAINAASGGYTKQSQDALVGHLEAMQSILGGLALGPEGRLCHQLLSGLRQRLRSKYPQTQTGLRPRLAKAGILHKSSCCDGEVNCCDCGCCDCNVCNCDPCGTDRDQCCEFNLCDCNHCCCFCDTGGSHRGSRGSGCSDCSPCNIFNCCGSDNNLYLDVDVDQPRTARRAEGRGFLERLGLRRSDFREQGSSARRCPSCALVMVKLSAAGVELEECRNCGGFWLDDKEIDALAKVAELPHNLLHRYPTEAHSKVNARGQRPCPVCDGSTLVNVPYLEVPVEMCRSCHGFWLEQGVLNRVLKAKHSPQRLSKEHLQEWRCPYCEAVAQGGSDTCSGCGAPRPKSGFTGKLG